MNNKLKLYTVIKSDKKLNQFNKNDVFTIKYKQCIDDNECFGKRKTKFLSKF